MFLPNCSSYKFSSYIPASDGKMSQTLLESSILGKPHYKWDAQYKFKVAQGSFKHFVLHFDSSL